MSAAASVAVALLVVAVVGSVSRPVSHKLTLANRAVSSRSVISISPPTHPPGKMEVRIEFVLSFLATTAMLGFLLQTVLYSVLCLCQFEANISQERCNWIHLYIHVRHPGQYKLRPREEKSSSHKLATLPSFVQKLREAFKNPSHGKIPLRGRGTVGQFWPSCGRIS